MKHCDCHKNELIEDLRDNPPHLAKMSCGHIQKFCLLPIKDWYEWCNSCHDFKFVVDGV